MILKCLNTKSVIYKLLNVKTVRVSLDYWYRIQICSITGLARRTAFPPVIVVEVSGGPAKTTPKPTPLAAFSPLPGIQTQAVVRES